MNNEIYYNNHKFEFYNDISELPIKQFHLYSKYVLLESGIGDTFSDIDSHITRIIEFMKNDTNKAYKELLNLRQCLYVVLNNQDLHNKAFLCLIKKVDDKMWADFSEGGLESLYSLVGRIPQGEFDKVAIEIRNRIDNDLSLYFPSIFSNARERNYLELLRKRALLQVDSIVNKKNHDSELEEIKTKMFSMYNVQSFEGKDSAEIAFDKQFEDMCLALAKEFGGKVKEYSVMEYYSAYERLDKQAKEMQKITKK